MTALKDLTLSDSAPGSGGKLSVANFSTVIALNRVGSVEMAWWLALNRVPSVRSTAPPLLAEITVTFRFFETLNPSMPDRLTEVSA